MDGRPPALTPSPLGISVPTPDREEIVALLPDEMAHVRKAPLYFVGLSLVALVMVLLPIAYVGLILLTGFATYLHTVHNVGILEGGGLRVKLVLYLGPIIAGIAVCFFMIKPLFARRPSRAQPLTLARDEEPLLFLWVERLSSGVGAPTPRRIDVDCEVNASASFRREWLSLMGGDLVLTIGAPLAAGMTLRQFTGVLAHELGHFAQGGGMRLSYVIRSINYWFARVVYERDSFDVALDEAQQRWSWWGFALVVALSRGCIWISRKVLWSLMQFGHLISSFLLQQMEFDADRYESRIAGSEEFGKTVERLHALMVGHQLAMEKTGLLWAEKRLPDDLPALCVSRAGMLEEETWKQYLTGVMNRKTSRWASHPSDHDRVANALREDAVGLLQTDLPATILFRDFHALSRRASLAYFGALLGGEVDARCLWATEELLQAERQESQRLLGVARFVQGGLADGGLWYPSPGDAAEERAEEEIRRELEEIRAGLQSKRGAPFHERRALADRRLGVALEWLARPDSSAGALVREEELQAGRLLTVLNALHRIDSEARGLGQECEKTMGLASRLHSGTGDERLQRDLHTSLSKVHSRLAAIRHQLDPLPYPFDHVDGGISCAGYVVPEVPAFEDPGRLMNAASRAIELLGSLYQRALTGLVETAEHAEAAIGLQPLDPPPPATDPDGMAKERGRND